MVTIKRGDWEDFLSVGNDPGICDNPKIENIPGLSTKPIFCRNITMRGGGDWCFYITKVLLHEDVPELSRITEGLNIIKEDHKRDYTKYSSDVYQKERYHERINFFDALELLNVESFIEEDKSNEFKTITEYLKSLIFSNFKILFDCGNESISIAYHENYLYKFLYQTS